MRLTIDTERQSLIQEDESGVHEVPLYSVEGFKAISSQWLRVGWNQKYTYAFTWMGRPVIQLPEDLIRIQEVLFAVQPDVIIETGIAHGGSLIYYASLCKVMDRGRVIGVDREIRPHNRAALERHPLVGLISMVEGSSIDPATVNEVRGKIAPGETVFVLLDSCHTKEHVRAELEAYGALVTPGSYIVATDGIMAEVAGVPRGQPEWDWNNPLSAVHEFAAAHPEFRLVEPPFPFNEGTVHERVTHWPGAFLRRAA